MFTEMTIAVDDREKPQFTWFTSSPYSSHITLNRTRLQAADYENGRIVVEKKATPAELCLTLSKKRLPNFIRSVKHMCDTYEKAYLIIGFDKDTFAKHKPFGHMTVADCLTTLEDICAEYPLRVIWSKSNKAAERAAAILFNQHNAPQLKRNRTQLEHN